MDQPEILVERGDNGRRTIWLNAPARRNALSTAMMGELTDAVRSQDEDDACRVILVRGKGGSFCAGRALPRAGKDVTPTDLSSRLDEAMLLARQMLRCGKPLVGVVEGYAIGMGVSLPLWCDFAIAESAAIFQAPEVRRGFPATMTAVSLLRRAARGPSMEFLLSGRRFSAEEARDAGIVSRVVTADDLERELDNIVRAFDDADLKAVAACKALLRETETESFDEALATAAGLSVDWEGCVLAPLASKASSG